MIEIPTLKDVREAWNEFNNLPVPSAGIACAPGVPGFAGSPEHEYAARDAAWLTYTKVRDHYLYSIKRISLTELNSKWYRRESGYRLGTNLQ